MLWVGPIQVRCSDTKQQGGIIRRPARHPGQLGRRSDTVTSLEMCICAHDPDRPVELGGCGAAAIENLEGAARVAAAKVPASQPKRRPVVGNRTTGLSISHRAQTIRAHRPAARQQGRHRYVDSIDIADGLPCSWTGSLGRGLVSSSAPNRCDKPLRKHRLGTRAQSSVHRNAVLTVMIDASVGLARSAASGAPSSRTGLDPIAGRLWCHRCTGPPLTPSECVRAIPRGSPRLGDHDATDAPLRATD